MIPIRRFVLWSVMVFSLGTLCTSQVFAQPRTFARGLPSAGSAGSNFQVLYNFPAGTDPSAGLISQNGMLYGTARNVGGLAGDVFAATTTGIVTELYHFTGAPDGADPDVLTYVNGQLYGVTAIGGDTTTHDRFGCGTFFAVALTGGETKRTPFDCAVSFAPTGKLVPYHGALFGEAAGGGANDSGTVFVAHDDGTMKTLYSFPGYPLNEEPEFGLTEMGGVFYGIARGHQDEIFAILPTGVAKVIYVFAPNAYQTAQTPYSRLTAVNGVLYGTTLSGGTFGKGSIFAVTPSGAERVIYSFKEQFPNAIHLTAMGGALYGQFEGSDPPHAGAIFKVTFAGELTIVHSFFGPDGANPEGDLVQVGRYLYGTTISGGANNGGTLYRITP